MAASATVRRRKERYNAEVRTQLKETLGLGNIMEVPRLKKIVLNCGVGRATQQASLPDGAFADLTVITRHKPLVTTAKNPTHGFQLPAGNTIGSELTLACARTWA